MTTNVLDNVAKRLTSDSRWSLVIGSDLVFVDDTGFDKIADRASAGMICAGNAMLIDAWKNWFLSDVEVPLPPTEVLLATGALQGICVTILAKPSFTIDFTSGDYYPYMHKARFCGSGASAAMACYSINECSTQCIETAKQTDPMTGGSIKHLSFTSFEHNLAAIRAGYKEAEEKLLTQGFVMDLTTKNIRPLGATDQEVVRKHLSANTVSLSAPMGGLSTAWTGNDRERAEEAMRRIRAREKAANCG